MNVEFSLQPFLDGNPFQNWSVKNARLFVDFYVDREECWGRVKSLRESLRDRLHANQLLSAATVTSDADPSFGIRFFNIAMPIDEHTDLRIATAANIVSEWLTTVFANEETTTDTSS